MAQPLRGALGLDSRDDSELVLHGDLLLNTVWVNSFLRKRLPLVLARFT